MGYYYGDMCFEVPKRIYEPGEDSELIAKVIESLDLSGKTVLEIGCGCGFLAILTAKAGAHVTAVDIDENAVEITITNANANGVLIKVIKSDLFSNISGIFDLIVFNPPYLPVEDNEQDNTYAGGETGRETIKQFIESVGNYLVPGGIILLVISSLTGEKKTTELFEKHGLHAEAIAREKIPWEELIVIQAARP